VVFRFPAAAGSAVRVYRLPHLDEITFKFNAPGLAAARVLGYADDDDQIYLLSPRGTLIALDLITGRSRTVDSSIVAATAGPTGTPYVVHADGSVAAIEHRAPTRWSSKLSGAPEGLVGAGRGTLLVELRRPGDAARQLVTLNATRPAVNQPMPEGVAAASWWGDAVVIGTDSGLVVLGTVRAGRPDFVRTDVKPAAIALSPSAHRAYAVVRGELEVIDRFTGRVVAKRDLPGKASELRPDAWGRLLLVRPAVGDSVWIFDVATSRYMATIQGSWSADLPAVAADGNILLRQGNDLIAVSQDSLLLVGRVRGAGNDRWLAVGLDPRRPILQLLPDQVEPTQEQSNQELYVQVSVSQNQAWADDNAQNLRRAGLNASVLPPANPDEGYRVVLGPYPTREAAEDAGRKLGRPFWIFSRQQTPPNQ